MIVRNNLPAQSSKLSAAKQALLEKRIQGKLGNVAKGQTIPRRSPYTPASLSFAQQRLWFLHRLNPKSPVYNIPVAIRIEGPLNLTALEQSFNQIIQRHEILQTIFAYQDGQPVQMISRQVHISLPIFHLEDIPNERERKAKTRRLINKESQRPFDLTQGPLFRAGLLRLGQTEHVLLLTVHHIIFDEWSMGILTQEITRFYKAFSQGTAPSPAALPIQYADFAHWQRQWLQEESLEAQLEYWKDQLGDDPPPLALPVDHPRPKQQSYRGATQSLVISDFLATKLKTFSRQQGVTLFMTLLAAFQTLLYRYTGQDDILIGTPIANRTQAETEALIGLFVNTLVLRTNLSGNPTFLELVKRVQRVALGSYAHQDLPFEVLVEELKPARDLSHHPLFQVMFVFQHPREDSVALPELTLTPLEIDNGTAKFDLTLFVEERSQELVAKIEYNTDLFEPSTINRMLRHFRTLLDCIVADPQQRLLALPLLTQPEQHKLLVEWNDTQADYPRNQCFHHLFEAQVERTPGAVAVTANGQQVTYQELNRQANQLAHHLQSSGVGPEALVGIFVERSVEMVIGLLGILKAGGAYVPLDPTNPPDRLRVILDDAKVSVLLTQQHLAGRLPEIDTRVICLDTTWPDIATASANNPVEMTTSENLAYVIYTSGSTGKPKGVAIPHRGLVNYLWWVLQTYPLDAGAGAPVHSSISFDLTITGLFAPLLAGRTVHLLPNDLAVETLAAALQSNGNYSLVKITPAHLELLGQQLSAREAVGRTHAFIIGGEQLLAENTGFWQVAAPDIKLINEYGPTETVVGCCTYQVTAAQHTSGPIPIGRPIANTKIYVLDTNLQPVPIGVPGELYIGGAGVARGYLKRPDLTAEKFIPNPFGDAPGMRLYKTGDLARYLPDGNLEFLGRIDQQVKIRGYRIELGEIEAILRQHPAVQEAVAKVWKEIPGYKALLAAYLVASKRPNLDELRRFVRAKLPEYMLPSAFMILDELPLAANGKVNRQALPLPVQNLRQSDKPFSEPRDTLEHQLTELWEEILDIHPISINDNFFEIGGHSLLAVQVFAQIENQLGKKLPVVTLFKAPTIAQLAQIIRQEEETATSSLVAIQSHGSRPPFFCVHGMGGGVLDYAELARYLGREQPFYGLQERAMSGDYPLFDTVQEMAAHYVTEIQSLQPEGPYYLGGYCYGGTVAYEMARQFQAQGQRVALLAIMDNSPPNVTYQESVGSVTFWFKFFKNLPYWLHDFLQLNPTQMVARIRRKLRIIRQRRVSQPHPSAKPIQADIEAIVDIDLSQIPERHHHLLRAHYQAMSAYVPGPYEGPVTLFRTHRHSLFGPFDPQMGWGELAVGGLEIKEIKGFHANILQEPYVQTLAQQLSSSLHEVQANVSKP